MTADEQYFQRDLFEALRDILNEIKQLRDDIKRSYRWNCQ